MLVLTAIVIVIWTSIQRTTINVRHDLAQNARAALIDSAVTQVSTRFRRALDSLLLLRHNTRAKFPNFATDTRISNVDGWLSVTAATAVVSREVQTLGFVNQCQSLACADTAT
jgi:hypothetical protein